MSAEATTDQVSPLENCAPLVPTQQRRDGGGGAAGVTFDLKPLNPSSKYVKLNVGGSLHYTTVQTLTKQDTMLKAMFSGRMEVLTDSEGWILIDRSGRHFGTILNYLRDGSVSLPESQRELEEVLCEARYYLIQGLVEDCQLALQQKSEAYDPLCHIPMVTSPKEEQQIISSCTKPVVKLLHNRSNNKYSYTSNSDDNLLKNIELFDKLALRFNGRVLFIKDVLGDEICCWSFYGQGRKIAEVCCTSIVYATEKKQTKFQVKKSEGNTYRLFYVVMWRWHILLSRGIITIIIITTTSLLFSYILPFPQNWNLKQLVTMAPGMPWCPSSHGFTQKELPK